MARGTVEGLCGVALEKFAGNVPSRVCGKAVLRRCAPGGTAVQPPRWGAGEGSGCWGLLATMHSGHWDVVVEPAGRSTQNSDVLY